MLSKLVSGVRTPVRTTTLKIKYSLLEELVSQTITERVLTVEMSTVKFTLTQSIREPLNSKSGTLPTEREMNQPTSTQ